MEELVVHGDGPQGETDYAAAEEWEVGGPVARGFIWIACFRCGEDALVEQFGGGASGNSYERPTLTHEIALFL